MAGPTRYTGYPDYSSTGTSKFIPEVWAGKLTTKFYATTCFGSIASTDFQGDVKGLGDNVIIRSRPTITINDYQIGQTLTYEHPEQANTTLAIDRAKSFSFGLNDVDRYQSDIALMDEFTDDATEQMQIVIDKDILGTIYGDVAAANAGGSAGVISGNINLGVSGTPLSLTTSNVTDFIVDMGQVLDEQNVPHTGRWLVVPAWVAGLLKKSPLHNANEMGDNVSILRNGRLGMIDRFEIFVSNNLTTVVDGTTSTNCTNVVAGHRAGLTFASQMTEMEELPNPNDFGRLVRGLNVYGFKTIEPNYLAAGYVDKG